MTDEMLVVDDSLLLFNPKPGGNRIPAHTRDGHHIRSVSDHAWKHSDPRPAELVVEEGIQSIGDLDADKLILPNSLREWNRSTAQSARPWAVELWRGMRADAWRTVLANSHPIPGNRQIFTGSWETLGARCPDPLHTPWFPFGADELFAANGAQEPKSFTDPLPCLAVEGGRERTSILDAIMRIVRGKARNVIHPQAERTADLLLRGSLFGREPPKPNRHLSDLVIIDPPMPRGGNGRVMFRASVIRAQWYYCTARPLVLRGVRYWVGSLNFLNGSGYDRTDVAVFTEKGPVSSRAVTEEVYAKYLLMSIL